MTSIWLSFKAWAALVVLGLLAVIAVQQIRVSQARAETFEVRQEFADARTKAAQEAQAAEAAARAEEARREAVNQEIRNDAKRQTEMAQADALAAAAARDSLREQLAKYSAAARRASSNPSAAGRSQTADPMALLTDMLGRLDERAGVYAAAADRAHVAGTACERYAQSLQP